MLSYPRCVDREGRRDILREHVPMATHDRKVARRDQRIITCMPDAIGDTSGGVGWFVHTIFLP
jgi:hypothetical protein